MTALPLDIVEAGCLILAAIVIVLATIAILAVRGESRAHDRADRMAAELAALVTAAHDRPARPLATVVRSHRTKPLPRFVRHETTRFDLRSPS